jgi:hypothetical protein
MPCGVNQGKDSNFLLRGKDLRDAEQWMGRSSEHEPKPTSLQVQYLLLKQQAATRLRRVIFGAVAAVAFLIAAGLVLYA